MNILIASISGGHFPYQMAALIHLTKLGFKPEVCMGGSGGAMAICCASGGDWSPSGILRVANSLDNSLFIDNWATGLSSAVPDYVLAYFYGSVYKSSDRARELTNLFFTKRNLQNTEIWVAAVNENTGSVALFCNRGIDNATIKGNYLNRRLHNYEEIRYIDGNLEMFTLAIAASSSIPMFVQPIKIDDHCYVDCGTKYGSPLGPLSEEIVSISRCQGVHMVYLSGYNIQTSAEDNKNIRNGTANMGEHLKKIPNHIVRSMIEHDRSCAYSIVNDWCDREPNYLRVDIRDLEKALAISEKSKCSLIEIYPLTEESIDVFDFCGDDLVKFITDHEYDLGIRMWYS